MAAVVVDTLCHHGRSQLRRETDAMRILHLEDGAVFAEPISNSALLRVQGTLEVLAYQPPSAVCVLTPFDQSGALERRQWIRVPTVLPVEIEARGGQHRRCGDPDVLHRPVRGRSQSPRRTWVSGR